MAQFRLTMSLTVISNHVESSLYCDNYYITTVLLVDSLGDINSLTAHNVWSTNIKLCNQYDFAVKAQRELCSAYIQYHIVNTPGGALVHH